MLFGAGRLPRHSGDQVGAQVPSPDCLTLRLASNRIPTFRWDIYSAVTFVTEAIRPKKYLTPITCARLSAIYLISRLLRLAKSCIMFDKANPALTPNHRRLANSIIEMSLKLNMHVRVLGEFSATR